MLTPFDIFIIVATICIALFTVFLCWILYYLAQILKDVKETTTRAKGIVMEADTMVKEILATVQSARAKLGTGLTFLPFLIEKIRTLFYRAESNLHRKRTKKSSKKEAAPD